MRLTSAIVNIVLYVTVCELLDIEEYPDLDIYVRSHSMSLEVAPFESFGTVYTQITVCMAVSLAVSTQCTNVTD